ncbi:hypothetical protein B484DRAFT_400745 [Ochromonadaceae sp. CCMP2298]|nr:hypothetical protein B484DRAFT_400745 [Ochromonadaceae sp. CCMP2298]
MDFEDWVCLFQYHVLDTIKLDQTDKLTMRAQLAVATIIIGSRTLSLFPKAAKILSAWHHVGGAYWLVQLEILRHAALYLIRVKLSGLTQKSFDSAELKAQITTMLTQDTEPDLHTHKLLKLKIAMLRADLHWLLDAMHASTNPYDEFVQYYAVFELSQFVPWYLLWALDMLSKSAPYFEQSDTVAEILRVKMQAKENEMRHYAGSVHVPSDSTVSEELVLNSNREDSLCGKRRIEQGPQPRPPKRHIQEGKEDYESPQSLSTIPPRGSDGDTPGLELRSAPADSAMDHGEPAFVGDDATPAPHAPPAPDMTTDMGWCNVTTSSANQSYLPVKGPSPASPDVGGLDPIDIDYGSPHVPQDHAQMPVSAQPARESILQHLVDTVWHVFSPNQNASDSSSAPSAPSPALPSPAQGKKRAWSASSADSLVYSSNGM